MLRQRVYGMAQGWEDLNDHGALRCDVAMQTAVERFRTAMVQAASCARRP